MSFRTRHLSKMSEKSGVSVSGILDVLVPCSPCSMGLVAVPRKRQNFQAFPKDWQLTVFCYVVLITIVRSHMEYPQFFVHLSYKEPKGSGLKALACTRLRP